MVRVGRVKQSWKPWCALIAVILVVSYCCGLRLSCDWTLYKLTVDVSSYWFDSRLELATGGRALNDVATVGSYTSSGGHYSNLGRWHEFFWSWK